MEPYDVVIIGSGMGGLICANILSMEGYRVCVLEKNKQLGGNLQTFVRDRVIFDSGVHYIGGLEKGQNLYQIFRYLGVLDQLEVEKMEEVFDVVLMENDSREYPIAQGFDHFIRHLTEFFPEEEAGIRKYCDLIREVCERFPFYQLRSGGSAEEKNPVMELNARDLIRSCTTNEKLQAILAGNNMLYAGQGDKTPFYIHALISNHYIESAWKCVNGGSQISKALAKNIRKHGGEIIRRAEVVKLHTENDQVCFAELKDGSKIQGRIFISNAHPVKTLAMTESGLIKPLYRNRLKSLENSVSSFSLHLVLKKNQVPYQKKNYYFHKAGHIWDMTEHTDDNWPLGYAVYFNADPDNREFASGISILTYMRYKEVEPWSQTFNTTLNEAERGDEYEAFKKSKADKLINLVSERFPDLKKNIQACYSATPLTFRDYIGSDDGSMYGIVKDCRDFYKTFLSPRTKIPNLYLTGQNLNLHGILGAAMSGLVTCTAIMGNENIIDKIKNA